MPRWGLDCAGFGSPSSRRATSSITSVNSPTVNLLPQNGMLSASSSAKSVSFVVLFLVGIGEVAGLRLRLALFLPNMIELRVIKHESDRIIPAQFRMFFEGRCDPLPEVLRNCEFDILELLRNL